MRHGLPCNSSRQEAAQRVELNIPELGVKTSSSPSSRTQTAPVMTRRGSPFDRLTFDTARHPETRISEQLQEHRRNREGVPNVTIKPGYTDNTGDQRCSPRPARRFSVSGRTRQAGVDAIRMESEWARTGTSGGRQQHRGRSCQEPADLEGHQQVRSSSTSEVVSKRGVIRDPRP